MSEKVKASNNELSNDTSTLEQKKSGSTSPPRMTSPGMFLI